MGLLHPETNTQAVMKIKNAFILAIGFFGSFQIIGSITGSPLLRGLGLATGFAPFPKVFCETGGYEPFAATFTMTGIDEENQPVKIPFTAERYAQLDGPYQRRNVYGAALAYAPRLPQELRDHLLENLFKGDSTLARELGLPQLTQPGIHIKAREGEDPSHYQFQLD